MSELIKDVHVSGLKYVGESVNNSNTTNNKYKRYSIPHMDNRHCLGYIEGPAASFSKRTRNDHMYVLKLWENVENSEDFKEGMNCATIIGELDHPEERIDYSLTKGAVVLTDWEIRRDEGIVWCRFAILDNDEGRTLLSYVKFGTILGVSSRGLGDEIIVNGESIIDPDTYEFYCFDVVAFPAASDARTTYVSAEELKECKSVKSSFADKVNEEIEKADDAEALNNLKNVVESTNVPDKATLIESITDKLSRVSESTDTQSDEGEEESSEDKLILLSNQIEEKDKKIKSLEDRLKHRSDNAKFFRTALQEKCKEMSELEDALDEGLITHSQLAEELNTNKDKYNESLSKVNRDNEALRESLNTAKKAISRYRVDNLQLTRRLNNMTNSLDVEKESNSKLISRNRHMSERLSKCEDKLRYAESNLKKVDSDNRQSLIESAKLSRNKDNKISELQDKITKLESSLSDMTESVKAQEVKLQESNKKLMKASNKLLDDYVRQACKYEGLNYDVVRNKLSENYTKVNADKVIKEAVDLKQRFDSLPISMKPLQGKIVSDSSNSNSAPSFVVEALRRG